MLEQVLQRMINFAAKTALLLTVALTAACTVGPAPKPNDPEYAPVTSLSEPLPPANPGGIYRGSSFGLTLYEDRRALRVGDILTIVLSERTTATKTAETAITKDNEIALSTGQILGDEVTFGDYSLNGSATHERDFEGEAESDQSNALQGSIAVTVADVLPNGLLLVRGEKWMTLNTGDEFIRIRGLVRTEDIGPDNTILSTKLADARITYSGTGEFAQSNSQGWLSRFFNSEYWPF